MLKRVIQVIDKINYMTGLLLGFVVLLIMVLVVYEVTSRYFFDAPTLWSMEINQYLFCGVSLMGGRILSVEGRACEGRHPISQTFSKR